jgi:hypothetical protein
MGRFSKSRVGALLLLIVVSIWMRGFAQAASSPSARPTEGPSDNRVQSAPSEGQLRFAKAYIAAVNANDLKALRLLVAPKTLACYSERTEPYLTQWLMRQTGDPISQPYTITVEAYDEGELHTSALFTLPVQPTHQMNISTSTDENDVVLGRPIAYQDGRWYETAPCPTDLGMEQLLKRDRKVAAKKAQLDALYDGLKDPMRSDLKKLISQNRIGEACDKYTRAQKIDFITGCTVVKRLAASMGIVVK